MVLTRRIRLWLHMRINYCTYYICMAAGLMSAKIQAAARSLRRALLGRQVALCSYPTASPMGISFWLHVCVYH